MNKSFRGVRTDGHARRAWLLLLGAAFFGPAAADGSRIEGTWVGSSLQGNKPVAVRMAVHGGTHAAQVDLSFGAPHHCRVVARRSGMFPGGWVYDVEPPTGGAHCDALYPGTLRLVPDGAGLTLVAGDGRHAAHHALRRQGSAPPAGEDDPRPLLGTWLGTVLRDGTSPVGVRLDLGGVEPGDRRNTLRYSSPRQCSVALAYEGAAGRIHYFSIPESPGGYCDRLAGAHLWARLRDNQLVYGFQPDNADCQDECELERGPGR